jgi:putative peptidoglycan lipid II flippase
VVLVNGARTISGERVAASAGPSQDDGRLPTGLQWRATNRLMSLARDITTVGSGTLMSRLLAYLRDAWIAALLGAGPYSEAFFAVLQVVNFFRRLLSEGALNGAFVPIWLKLRAGEDGIANAARFTRRVLLTMFCIAGFLALLIILFAPVVITVIAPGFDRERRSLAAFLLFMVAPYIVVVGIVAVIAAALNAEGRVRAVAISTAMFNLVMVLTLVILPGGEVDQFYATAWLAFSVSVAGLIQLVLTATVWLSTGNRWQRAHTHARDQTETFFKRAFPGLIAAGVPQLKLIAATAIASASPAAVSWLYYANRLYELPLGVASVAISAVIVPRIAAGLVAADGHALAAAQSRAYEIGLGLALPAAAGFVLLANPIVGGLFERGAFGAQDTVAVAGALAAISAGLPGHILEKTFGAVSFAHEDAQTPMLAALSGLAAAIIGGLMLFPRYGHIGVAAAFGASGWVGAAVLGVVLFRRNWLLLDGDGRRRLPRIVFATAVMGTAIVISLINAIRLFPAAETSSSGRLGLLIVLVALGAAIYAATLRALGVIKLKEIVAGMSERI